MYYWTVLFQCGLFFISLVTNDLKSDFRCFFFLFTNKFCYIYLSVYLSVSLFSWVSSLFPPCEFWGQQSGHLDWEQSLLSTEPYCSLLLAFLRVSFECNFYSLEHVLCQVSTCKHLLFCVWGLPCLLCVAALPRYIRTKWPIIALAGSAMRRLLVTLGMTKFILCFCFLVYKTTVWDESVYEILFSHNSQWFWEIRRVHWANEQQGWPRTQAASYLACLC